MERKASDTKILKHTVTLEQLAYPALLQVHYVERVNAELHELLERYEGEFFQHQVWGRGVNEVWGVGDEQRNEHASVKHGSTHARQLVLQPSGSS